MIHGGGFVFGSRRDISKSKIDFFIGCGIHVATIDYRLSPESSFSETLEDVEDAINWIHEHIKKTGLDVTRFFVMGFSAGGFLAYHAGLLSPKADGIISMYGYADLSEPWCRQISHYYLSKTRVDFSMVSSLIGSKPISNPPSYRFLYYLYLRQQGKWIQTLFKSATPTEERLKQNSPLYGMGKDYPRTFIVHGMLDQDVPVEASKNISAKLESLGVSVNTIFLDHAEHDFDHKLDDQITHDVYDGIVKFIKDQEDGKF
ncbi:MAG TPA: hypothetical protein DCS67_06895 [Clostridiales bacterium UBA8960]|jgi:acetyl esterase/lipase|nr:hypothetical protein [Clostridiales bacterium UBA8960]